jgi:dCTP deaminase
MLAETAIVAARAAGDADIEPFNGAQLRGASYVLRLGDRFRRWTSGDAPVEMWSPSAAEEALDLPLKTDRLILSPGEFVLATTLERIGLGQTLAGAVSPLSHVARFGLSATLGADLINPGFGSGAPASLTLELFNHNRRALVLTAGMPIVHLRLIRLTGEAPTRERRSIYDGADPVVAPKLYEEWHTLLELGS